MTTTATLAPSRPRREERPAWCTEGINRLVRPLRPGDTQWVCLGDFPSADIERFQVVFDALRGLERTGRVRISRIHREAGSGKQLVDMIAVEKLRD